LEFEDNTMIAITGADMQPVLKCRDKIQLVARHCPVVIAAGACIQFQAARRGCRCYVAIAGGVDVPVVMGSRSTLLRAKFGGHCGRALMAGDELKVGMPADSSRHVHARLSEAFAKASLTMQPRWFVRPVDLPNPEFAVLRIVTGAHTSLLKATSRERLVNADFRISSQSDRMGYRLIDQQLMLETHEEMLSEAVVPGTLQLPPDGNPILLMADCAPTGGYPRIGHVISADLGIAAQLRPGQCVRFAMVTLADAQETIQQQHLIFNRAMRMAEIQSCYCHD
ncbi:MAG: biotin-dependent carboxyltransferase family protein, partial [Planctomycetota bacterium]|nr:biotin-dependent carboxyltransferase family protein [Planctomycetota bacterium]